MTSINLKLKIFDSNQLCGADVFLRLDHRRFCGLKDGLARFPPFLWLIKCRLSDSFKSVIFFLETHSVIEQVKKKVVITGVGAVSSVGIGAQSFFQVGVQPCNMYRIMQTTISWTN
jgi:hypothetical protein